MAPHLCQGDWESTSERRSSVGQCSDSYTNEVVTNAILAKSRSRTWRLGITSEHKLEERGRSMDIGRLAAFCTVDHG